MKKEAITFDDLMVFLKQYFKGDNWGNVPIPYEVGTTLNDCEACIVHNLTEKSAAKLNKWLETLKTNNCPSPDYASLWCNDDDLSLFWEEDLTEDRLRLTLECNSKFGTMIWVSNAKLELYYREVLET
jgi:hypothetical protein